MTLRTLFSLLVIITLTACSQPPTLSTEQQIIEDAIGAMGGRSNIEAAMTLSIEAEGTMGNLGQDLTPETAKQNFTISGYNQTSDLSSIRMRIEQTRTPNFNYFRGPDPIVQIFGIDGDVSYNIAANGNASRGGAAQATDRRTLYYHHPLKLLHAALQPTATLANGRTDNGESLVDVTSPEGLMFTLALDGATKLPSYIMSRENHPNLRDVSMQTQFSDYQDVNGLNLPTTLIQSIDDFELLKLMVTSQSISGEAGELSAPSTAAAAEAPYSPPIEVTVEKLADGIWLLPSGYNSLVVEFDDHLVLFESSSEARGLAVIAKARELVPGKPLTHLVNTHHHFDHSGGIRAAISEGLTVITQEANAAFYRQLATRTSSIVPDALEQKPQPATVIAVADKLVYGDETMKLEFYHIADNPHASSLLMVYFPEQKLLYEADVFSPGRPAQPFATKFLETVQALNLQFDQIVPVHGNVSSYDDLVESVRMMAE